MTEQWYQRENRFYVEDAWIDFEDHTDDDPEINAVVIDLLNSDQKLYLYPRTTVTQSGKMNGMDWKSDEDIPYRISNFPDKFSKLVKVTPDVADDQVIVIEGTCQVTEYDDGHKAYRMYDDMVEADSFNMEAVEYTEVHSNPEDMSQKKKKELTEEVMEDSEGNSASSESVGTAEENQLESSGDGEKSSESSEKRESAEKDSGGDEPEENEVIF